MCSGDAHGLDDLWIIPIYSILSNSAFAALNCLGVLHKQKAGGGDKVLYTMFACVLGESGSSDVGKVSEEFVV